MDGKGLYETAAMLAEQLPGIQRTVFADFVDRLTRDGGGRDPGTAPAILAALPEMYREVFVEFRRALLRRSQSTSGARRWLRDAGWVR